MSLSVWTFSVWITSWACHRSVLSETTRTQLFWLGELSFFSQHFNSIPSQCFRIRGILLTGTIMLSDRLWISFHLRKLAHLSDVEFPGMTTPFIDCAGKAVAENVNAESHSHDHLDWLKLTKVSRLTVCYDHIAVQIDVKNFILCYVLSCKAPWYLLGEWRANTCYYYTFCILILDDEIMNTFTSKNYWLDNGVTRRCDHNITDLEVKSVAGIKPRSHWCKVRWRWIRCNFVKIRGQNNAQLTISI